MKISTDRATWSMLADAFAMRIDIEHGDWAGVVAQCRNDCLKGVLDATMPFIAAELADMFEPHEPGVFDWVGEFDLTDNTNTFEFDRWVAVGVVDLYQRMLAGQWTRLADVRRVREPFDLWSLDMVRAAYAQNPPLRHPNCSLSAATLSDPGRRAYNVWHRLGGGIPDRGDQRVDGEFLWEVLDI